MKKVINPERDRFDWQIGEWYEKVAYILGWIQLIYIGLVLLAIAMVAITEIMFGTY